MLPPTPPSPPLLPTLLPLPPPPAQRLPDLLTQAAQRNADAVALTLDGRHWTYGDLAQQMAATATALSARVAPGARVAIWLDKRLEFVLGCFGAAAAGAVFVPVNPQLKPQQLAHVLADCSASLLLTTPSRLALLQGLLPAGTGLVCVCVEDGAGKTDVNPAPGRALTAVAADTAVVAWADFLAAAPAPAPAATAIALATARPPASTLDTDLCAIFYTSGSTGRPKGVMLSHRNLVCGAHSVASYLGNHPGDSLLAVLPLSFDAGFSQLTTAFASGARVVLLNYLLPGDVLKVLVAEGITGLTAVPALYAQLLAAPWPAAAACSLRYFANTGGKMPLSVLAGLRQRWPGAAPVLMYGLTEAFRSTYLPPAELDRRPGSIGRAIPNAQILVLREDGQPCAPGEPGELVHRGPLVAQGYWGDPATTALRFKPLPAHLRPPGAVLPEYAVFSGDTVCCDEEGFLFFIGRQDEMIKTSGYRVSPTEVEEVLYASGVVQECAVYGLPHDTLGQAVHASVLLPAGTADPEAAVQQALLHCRRQLPSWMVPLRLQLHSDSLPRNPNGKLDRRALAAQAAATTAAEAGPP